MNESPAGSPSPRPPGSGARTRVGAERLPLLQAVAAACVMLAVAWNVRTAGRARSGRVFVTVLAGPMLLFGLIGAGASSGALDARLLGLLFLGREVAFALVLLQFGVFLQDYFTRAELNRVMPVIYAGGRVGGILGGAVLEHASGAVPPPQMLLVLAGLLAAGIAGVVVIERITIVIEEPGEAEAAPATLPGVMTLLRGSPLFLWITVATAALFFCRTGLYLQCSLCFEREFADEAALARFLGRYTQIALAGSLLIQLLLVGRLASWIGLRGAQALYAALVAAAAVRGLGEMTLAAAVFARFVEGELRYGLRNPLAQMTVNLFPKPLRAVCRGWSMGLLIPATTLAASITFGVLMRFGAPGAVAAATVVAGAGYVAATLCLPVKDAPIPHTAARSSAQEKTALRSG